MVLNSATGSATRVARVRRKPGERVVAPVVGQSPLDEELLAHPCVTRHELDRCDAQAVQMVDHRGMRQTQVLAAVFRWDTRMPLRVSLDVQLVDDRVAPGHMRAATASPVERTIDDTTPGNPGRAIGGIGLPIIARRAAAERWMPGKVARQRERRRIHQQLRRIAPMPCGRMVRSVHPVAIQGSDTAELGRQEAVPDVSRARRQREPRALVAARIEQAQLDAIGDGGEHREIRSIARPVRTGRLRRARLQHRSGGAQGTALRKTADSGGRSSRKLCGKPCQGPPSAIHCVPVP